MSLGLPLVALLTLSNAKAPEIAHQRVVEKLDRPDVVTSAGLDRSRYEAQPRRDVAPVSMRFGDRALQVLPLLARGELGETLRARALAPLPTPLASMIERQVLVAAERIGGLTRLLKVTEALMCTPGLDFEKRGIRVSIGVSGDLE